MNTRRISNWRPLCVGMILLQSVLYGLLDPMAKQVYNRQIPVYSFLMLRYLLATIVLLALRGGHILRQVRTVPLRHYIVPCFCMAASYLFSNSALRLTAATNVAFLRSLSGLMAPLLLLIFYHKPYGRGGLLRQLGMLLGLYLLCAQGGLTAFGWGEVLALAAAAMGAGALAFGAQALHYVSPATLSCVQSALAVALCLGTDLISGAWGRTDWSVFLQPFVGFSVVYAALGCTVAGYLLQNTALEHASPRLVGVLQCTYPVLSALTAYLFLGERLSPWGLAGAGVILACAAWESLEKES